MDGDWNGWIMSSQRGADWILGWILLSSFFLEKCRIDDIKNLGIGLILDSSWVNHGGATWEVSSVIAMAHPRGPWRFRENHRSGGFSTSKPEGKFP